MRHASIDVLICSIYDRVRYIENTSAGLYAKVNAVYIGNAQATRAGIVAELEKVKAAAQPQDVFIFYYAGHGVMNDKKKFHLVPNDVTQLYGADEALAQKGVSAKLMQPFSSEIKAQKQLFILDACQSAGALENVVAMRGVAEEKAIAQLARATGTHWLTASGSEQFAAEFKQLGHGTFTYVLLEVLNGKADKGSDRKITLKELDAYLQEVVPEITAKYRDAAQYPGSYGFGNDFPIGVVKYEQGRPIFLALEARWTLTNYKNYGIITRAFPRSNVSNESHPVFYQRKPAQRRHRQH